MTLSEMWERQFSKKNKEFVVADDMIPEGVHKNLAVKKGIIYSAPQSKDESYALLMGICPECADMLEEHIPTYDNRIHYYHCVKDPLHAFVRFDAATSL